MITTGAFHKEWRKVIDLRKQIISSGLDSRNPLADFGLCEGVVC